jgi:O-antigen ligase
MINYQNSLDRIYQYLIIAAFFLLPLTVSGNNLAIWLAVLLWFFSGDYKDKFYKIKKNKLALSSIVFFLIHLLGLFWSENISWGLEIVRKMLPFFFVLPIFLTITRKDNVKFYISAFLLAISISETLSYLIWFGVIEPFKYAQLHDPTPLMSHISYNPFLAFAIYLVLNKLFSDEFLSQFERALYTFFTLTMSVNMFITGGRAGQVMFFAAIIVVMFQYFKNSQTKAILTSIALITFISYSAFTFSPLFKDRVMKGVENVTKFEENKNTPIGQRVTFVINSYGLFTENPIIGVGTGDFPEEYKRINKTNSPDVVATVQPHNMYLLVLAQLGIMGLISFLIIFYYQITIALSSQSTLVRHIGVAIPLLFLIIMWSDSYLLGHYTGNLFILFSSFIYSQDLDD